MAHTEARPRGILPDAVTDTHVILLKAAAYLRLTYEIRLATYMAKTRGLNLLIDVPAHTRFSPELAAFVRQHGLAVRRPVP